MSFVRIANRVLEHGCVPLYQSRDSNKDRENIITSFHILEQGLKKEKIIVSFKTKKRPLTLKGKKRDRGVEKAITVVQITSCHKYEVEHEALRKMKLGNGFI